MNEELEQGGIEVQSEEATETVEVVEEVAPVEENLPEVTE